VGWYLWHNSCIRFWTKSTKRFQSPGGSNLDPSKPPPMAKFAAEFLSAEKIIKWNHHSNKWLACHLKRIFLVISKLLVITDGRRFCNIKETDNNNKYITHFGSHSSLGSTSAAAQPKLFAVSQILADFFTLHDNSANPNISRIFFSAVRFFFKLQVGAFLGV